MDILRTPDSRFDNLKDYPFAANYLEVEAGEGTKLRMHYVDEGAQYPQVLTICVRTSIRSLYSSR